MKETKAEETPAKETKPEPKATPAPKKTPYQTYLEYRKHPHMGMLSQEIKKNDKGVEIIVTKWKNFETGETGLAQEFSASSVKEGDGIDLVELRKQAEMGLKAYMAEKAKANKKEEKPAEVKEAPKSESKVEPKAEPKKEEKKATSKKKEPVIIPEVVSEEEKKAVAQAKVTIPQTSKTGDRIDANHGIELMKSFENRATELEKGTELHRAMREHADIMLFVYGKQWLDQCLLDGDPATIQVNQSMYNRLAIIARDLLGMEMKALPVTTITGEQQMKIDFKETLESAPAEIQAAIEADAKKEKPSDVIPEVNTSITEEEKIKAIDSILRMKNGIGGNLHNAILYSKGAFPELKDACPAQVVAFIYSKIVTSTYLTGVAHAIMGNLVGNGSIIASHVWMKRMMKGFDYNETEIANIVKVILANELNSKGNYEAASKSCNEYISQMNDDLINRIINAKTPKDEANLKISGKYEELGSVQTTISPVKFINRIKEAYGADLSNKLLKQTMQRIMGLYSDGLKPLEVYVEKSAYVTK